MVHGAPISAGIRVLCDIVTSAGDLVSDVTGAMLNPLSLERAPSSRSLQPGRAKGSHPAGTVRVSGPPWLVDPDLGLSIFSMLLPAMVGAFDALGKCPQAFSGAMLNGVIGGGGFFIQLMVTVVRKFPSSL
jgi:hypothetical protein